MVTVVETAENDNVYCRFIKFPIVCGRLRTMKYGRNTVPMKRAENSLKRPFTTVLVRPGYQELHLLQTIVY
jgi:hypothetical protein